MKTSNYLIGLAALASLTLVGCSDNDFLGTDNGTEVAQQGNGEITFVAGNAKTTRAGEFIGATAAEKLGGMFVVEGTKGTEATDAPSSTVVFDNYLVGYTANTAGRTETNTNNWEYVGLQTGISGRMTAATWTALHPAVTAQTVKYWDYSVDQYDFIAWSTGTCLAVPTPDPAEAPTAGQVQVSRINTGNTLKTDGFTLRAASATDLLQCYYTDINTVTKASGAYGNPVTLTFRNMAAKVRIALYETVPGYSIKDVMFYSAEASDPVHPNDLGVIAAENPKITTTATLFTTGSDVLPQSGNVLVYYPRIGTDNREASPQTTDYNKASVTVSPGSSTSTTQTFGTLTAQYEDGYLGKTLPTATYAGDKTKDFYEAVIPNTNGKPLTLRVDYTLVSTDGSNEQIKVYGAKAVVPATYTVWQPNYAYTYVFKISDNSNGWTSTDYRDPAGLFPITFDAVVTNFIDKNAEQATVTTVATPSITTYQQGHNPEDKDEYSKNQKAGVSTAVKDVYVQVMDNSGATPSLKGDLNDTKKSLLYLITKNNADYVASEAEVMDALQNRTNTKDATSPEGRNGIKLTEDNHIDNTVTQIVNGVDDQPITKIAGVNISAGQVAKIDIANLAIGTYAYVYATAPTEDKPIYNVAAATSENYGNYYMVAPANINTTALGAGEEAEADKVYFVKNVDANGDLVSYTFKQTKVGDDVEGLYVADIPAAKANTYASTNFYFDVYNQNNGVYAVKVIKVVE